MRIARFCLSIFIATLVSCASPPPPPEPGEAPEPGEEPVVAEVLPPPVDPVPTPEPVFEVTPEKKQTILVEIRGLVDKLNAIIAKKSFSEWKLYLDRDYVRIYGDPVRLREYSANSPFLKQFKVNLKSLEDYFKFVVVPSRADTVVDDISFVDENRVIVWTVVDNEKVLLYLLKLYDKEWKISSW